MVAGGEYFPVLQVSDASFDCGPYSGDQFVVIFCVGVKFAVFEFPPRGDRGDADVVGIGNPVPMAEDVLHPVLVIARRSCQTPSSVSSSDAPTWMFRPCRCRLPE